MSERQRLIPIMTFSGANSVIIPDLGALIAEAEEREQARLAVAEPKPPPAAPKRAVLLGRVGGLASGFFS